MNSNYIFDKDNIRFRKKKTSVWAVVRRILMFFVASLSLAVVYYVIFSLVFSTDEEKKLRQENRMYEKEYPALEEKERLLSDVVEGLQVRDDRIYEEIFHASAPNMDPGSSLDYLVGIDSIPDRDIVKRSAGRLKALESRAAAVESNFRTVIAAVQDKQTPIPPMANPLKEFSFARVGASVGDRINPFYKVKIAHNGLDLIAAAGEPVHAAADGVVENVTKSRKGLGNVVTINHGNGYRTRYAHLADIEVRKGRNVKRGTRIGYVGMSGNSFAPHLHYEVLRDTLVLDPVHYFFGSVSPEEYVNMLIMSASTGQSMD
jgi:murein DD-endopeptidase MepM/ murein hydrolase activator NlpD